MVVGMTKVDAALCFLLLAGMLVAHRAVGAHAAGARYREGGLVPLSVHTLKSARTLVGMDYYVPLPFCRPPHIQSFAGSDPLAWLLFGDGPGMDSPYEVRQHTR